MNLIKCEPQPQSIITWYRPSERMPPLDKIVLISVSGKIYKASNYYEDSWRTDGGALHRNPEYWAELPEVPGGEA